jgi:hypothetical protein
VAFVRPALLASILSAFACADGGPAPDLGLAVASLTGDGLPDDVRSVRVTWRIDGGKPTTREATLDQLEVSEGRTRLSIERIPEDTPIELTVEGVRSDGKAGYAGSVGPLQLSAGEQARVRVVLFGRDASEMLPAAPPGRFLHAATRLADGRVLVSGGFGAPEPADCPADAGSGALCFSAEARRDAWLFDPTSATFSEVSGELGSARGGHTATVLGDGRVLLAGGATSVLLVLARDELGFEPRFSASGQASYELFDPAPSGDQGPRDPARGRLVGGGPLLAPRFLHAAEASPLAPERVVLAGGLGEASSTTYEVFDAAGRGGVLPDSLVELSVARTLPSAVALRDGQAAWIWLFGGASASSNDDLAERWLGDADNAIGSVEPATESAFPNGSGSDDTRQPLYALVRPVAVTLTSASRAFVTGGLGPRCTAAGAATFELDDTLPCSDADQLRAGFLVEAATGATTRARLPSAHILGAGAALADGRAVVSGGFVDRTLKASPEAHLLLFTSELRAGSKELLEARALHTSTAFGAAGVLTTGGLVLDDGELELVTASEVAWF